MTYFPRRSDWRYSRLGDVATQVVQRVQSDLDIEVFSVTKHSGFVPSSEYFKKQVFSRDIAGYKVVKPGQFAYATIHLDEGSIGLLNHVDQVAISPMYTVFEVDESKVHSPYLIELLKSPPMIASYSRLGSGSVHRRKSIPFSTLAGLTIPLPPLPEQRRIAAILDKADAIRRKRRQAIQLTEDLLRATFLETVGPRNPDYQSWPQYRMEELASDYRNSMRTGPFGSDLKHSEFVDQGVAVLGIDNAVNNRFEWAGLRFVTSEKYEKLKRYRVFPGDVIITIMGTTGRSAVVPQDIPLSISTKHLATITLNRKIVDPEFVSNAVHRHPHVLSQIRKANRGAIMSGLNLTLIKRLEIRVPPIDVQRRFSEMQAKVRASLDRIRVEDRQDDVLFNSLVQRAFRGEL